MDKGLLIIGGLLSLTIWCTNSTPLTLIGAYFVYNSLKDLNKEINDEIEKTNKQNLTILMKNWKK